MRAVADAVATIRPERSEPARIDALLARLESDPEERARLGRALREVASTHRSIHALTTSGILPEDGFLEVAVAMAGRRILPELREPDDLHAVIRAVFPSRRDHEWVHEVSEDAWLRLFEALELPRTPAAPAPELDQALQVLAHRIGGLGLRPEIAARMPWLDPGESPFLALSDEVLHLLRAEGQPRTQVEGPQLSRALDTLDRCRGAVERLRADKPTQGTSLKLTALTHRLLQLLDRLELLLHLTRPCDPDFGPALVRLFRDLVRAECTRDSLVRHVQESTDLLLFQVVEHAAKKGRKFATATRGEYLRFLVSSLGGGLIVGVFALIKVLVDALSLPPVPEALLFSANYALCFVLIHLTGSTLATKQPAVTAHELARCMGGPGDARHLDALVETITRVWRTQFVSFVGNLVAAFPVGFAVAALYHRGSGAAPAAGAKAAALLADLHPWASGSLFYAGVAGVFLFSAGIVQGWVDNSSHHSRVPARIARHPVLVGLFGRRLVAALARFADRHLGAIAGNSWLGFWLGVAGMIGMLTGLPFDIRHIAFASAHFAMALEGLDLAVPASTVILTVASVSAIGFVNFAVSFSLALSMALESRGITFKETRQLVRLLLARLVLRPADFFYPPSSAESE